MIDFDGDTEVYQLRTKEGDGEFDYFVIYETPYLQDMIAYIEENEIPMEYHKVVLMKVREQVINVHDYTK
jgi:hypothetical protein